MSRLLASLLLFCLICTKEQANASYINNGRLEARNLNLTIGGALENEGELVGKEAVHIVCDTFLGKGLIQGPKINLKTNLFVYKGVINCSERCVITTSQPFDESMFVRQGKGEFVFVIDENLERRGMDLDFNSLSESSYVTDELNVLFP
jgi:hypothetical protein